MKIKSGAEEVGIIVARAVKSTYLEEGACTDHPKSAIFRSPFKLSNKFSGLMSR